jgi:hypothetical protein
MNEILTNNTSNTKMYKPLENTKWGFTKFSEKINGRIAMTSFLIIFVIELITKQKLIDLINLISFY